MEKIQTPALLLDIDKLRSNCGRMKDKAKKLNVRLRPHLKTGKCIQYALEQMESPQGPTTVSTLKEAEYFFDHGVTDLIYAVGLAKGKFERAAALIRKGCDLKVILDNEETARSLSAFCKENSLRIPVLIEIDSDGHRSGVRPGSEEVLKVAAALTDGAYLKGILTHAGDSYKCVGEEACAAAQENERASMVKTADALRKAGYNVDIVSCGSTPTAVYARNWDGVTEVRCGVYSSGDLFMAGIDVCKISDIAMSLLVEVIGHQKEKGWIITDGGWMALSRDRGTASQRVDQGYGVVCDLEGNPIDDLIVASANQEHGIVTSRSGKPVDASKFPVGTRLRILPNHACSTAAQHPQYYVIKDNKVTEIWPRIYGW